MMETEENIEDIRLTKLYTLCPYCRHETRNQEGRCWKCEQFAHDMDIVIERIRGMQDGN